MAPARMIYTTPISRCGGLHATWTLCLEKMLPLLVEVSIDSNHVILTVKIIIHEVLVHFRGRSCPERWLLLMSDLIF